MEKQCICTTLKEKIGSNRSAKCSGMKMQECHICNISSMVALLYRTDTNTDPRITIWNLIRQNLNTLVDGDTAIVEKMKKMLRYVDILIPSSRSNGIISLTASKMPLCLASWPSNSLAQALQQPQTEQPDSPEPQPQILFNTQKMEKKYIQEQKLLPFNVRNRNICIIKTLFPVHVRVSTYPPGTLSGRPLLTQLAP